MDLEVRGGCDGEVLTEPFNGGQRVPVKFNFEPGLILFECTTGLDLLREDGGLGGLLEKRKGSKRNLLQFSTRCHYSKLIWIRRANMQSLLSFSMRIKV